MAQFKTNILRTVLITASFQSMLIAATIMGTLSCNNGNKPEDTKEVAEEHNDAKFNDDKEKNAQFLVNAAEINMEEIQLAQLAKAKATAADVKDMAKMMEDAHTKSQGELAGLAAKKQVTLPAAATDNAQDAYKKLDGKTGSEFDKDYCDMMVSGHKDAISKFEKMAADATDQDIKDWANASLPALRTHLDHALNCQKMHEKK